MFRDLLREEFPHEVYIERDNSLNAFMWCCGELNLQFKKDFDMRQSHKGPGSDFFFKDEEDCLAFKLMWC